MNGSHRDLHVRTYSFPPRRSSDLFTLALALTCSFHTFVSRGGAYFNPQGQIAMWLMSPIWCALLSLCFFFRSPARAWAWLVVANLFAWALYATTSQDRKSTRLNSSH